MNVVATGDPDAPPVLLASGLGGAWFDWTRWLAPLAATGHRVIAFDRPGLGLSPVAYGPPGLARTVRELEAIAGWAGGRPVLVAHSMAALAAEALARLRPGLLSALVLVDPSYEPRARTRLRLTPYLTPVFGLMGGALDRTGLARALGPRLRRRYVRHEIATGEQIRQVYGRGSVLARIVAENQAYGEEAADLRALREDHPFPDLPLVVISALAGGPTEGHPELAAMSPQGRLVVLPDSGHLVQFDRPDAIVQAVP